MSENENDESYPINCPNCGALFSPSDNDAKENRKIVINKCFGGFGLSELCHKELMKLGHVGSLREEQQNDESYVDDKDWGDYHHESYGRDINRDDPMLVQVIENFGSKACSNRFSQLKIVEIPDNVGWWIHEYDGTEYIEEKHRSWA